MPIKIKGEQNTTSEYKYVFLLLIYIHFFVVGLTQTDFPYYMTRGTKNAGFPETDQVLFFNPGVNHTPTFYVQLLCQWILLFFW